MTTKNDGEQAFPSEGESRGSPKYHSPGMTLRDWFAGQALAGYLAGNPGPGVGTINPAKWAYAYADAMLEERAK